MMLHDSTTAPTTHPVGVPTGADQPLPPNPPRHRTRHWHRTRCLRAPPSRTSVDAVEVVGTGSLRSASDTRCPLVTPEVTWVKTSPSTPTVTLVAFNVEPSTTVTIWFEPTVRTAEVGTVVAPTARLVTIDTPASTPITARGPGLDADRHRIRGGVPLVARIPMDVTFPLISEVVESGVTSASWPAATSPMSATGTSVDTE